MNDFPPVVYMADFEQSKTTVQPRLTFHELRRPEPRRRSEFLYVCGAPLLIYVSGLLLGIILGARFL